MAPSCIECFIAACTKAGDFSLKKWHTNEELEPFQELACSRSGSSLSLVAIFERLVFYNFLVCLFVCLLVCYIFHVSS